MRKIMEFLNGKKTYITFGIAFILGGLSAVGIVDQETVIKVNLFLGPLGLAFMRAGVKKIETK